jgi:hypothetical protein
MITPNKTLNSATIPTKVGGGCHRQGTGGSKSVPPAKLQKLTKFKSFAQYIDIKRFFPTISAMARGATADKRQQKPGTRPGFWILAVTSLVLFSTARRSGS